VQLIERQTGLRQRRRFDHVRNGLGLDHGPLAVDDGAQRELAGRASRAPRTMA
jgi:hypothetical protein